METLVWLGTWEGPLGPSVGRLGEGCVKSTPLWGEDSHIELWWTLNTNCSPVDIQGQSSYCETRIRSQSGKRCKWKWNQIMSWGFLVNGPQASAAHHHSVIGFDKMGWETCNLLGNCTVIMLCILLKNIETLKRRPVTAPSTYRCVFLSLSSDQTGKKKKHK